MRCYEAQFRLKLLTWKNFMFLLNKGEYKFPVELSEESKDLIRKLLVVNPSDRLSIPEILAHPWIKEDEEEEEESEADETDLVTGVSMSRNECSSSTAGAIQNTEDTRANINVINVDNIFWDERNDKYKTKLSYDDYCALTQDYYTYRIDEDALKVMETFGFPRKLVIDSIHKNDLNHATATYNLLVLT